MVPLSMKTCPYCGKEYPDQATVCAVDHTPLSVKAPAAAVAVASEPRMGAVNPCPSCGALAGHKPVVKLGESFSWLAFWGGGIFAVILLNAGRAKRVQCSACGSIFSIRPPASVISLLLFWLLVAPTVLFLAGFLVYTLWTFFTSQ